MTDTTVIYPRFIKFCVDVYNWGDHLFNSYDPEYVVGTGKRWKARIVSDNWVDSYAMTLPRGLHTWMLSDLYSNIGAYLQYMAVSYGYTYDISNMFGGSSTDHKKMEFGFNCARFNAEIYYQENTGGTNLRRFGKYQNGHIIKERFRGLNLKISVWKHTIFSTTSDILKERLIISQKYRKEPRLIPCRICLHQPPPKFRLHTAPGGHAPLSHRAGHILSFPL